MFRVVFRSVHQFLRTTEPWKLNLTTLVIGAINIAANVMNTRLFEKNLAEVAQPYEETQEIDQEWGSEMDGQDEQTPSSGTEA